MSVRRALVCAPLMPWFDRESGGQSIWDLIMFLREEGWAVSFACENPAEGARYKRLLQQHGVAVYDGFDERLDDLIAHGRLDLAIFAFWYTAEALLRKVRVNSPATRVAVNTMDLHFLRNARRLIGAAGGAAGALDEDAGDEYRRELNAYAGSDGVFCVSRKEAGILADLLGEPDLVHVVTDYEHMPDPGLGFDERRGILFVGNFQHPPNVEAAEFLCREIVPRIDPSLLEEHPVYIVGNQLVEKGVGRLAEGIGGVRMVGWVPTLTPYYHRTRIVVAPLLHGAGTKRKVLQALTVGEPIVSTSMGVEGFDLAPGRDLLVADEPAAFASAVERLLTDRDLWQELSANGRAAVAAAYDRDEVKRRFLATVESLLERDPKRVDPTPAELNGDGPAAYGQLVERIRSTVEAHVPDGGPVVVASKGDEKLLRFKGVEGWHFPQAEGGIYAGYYPRDSQDAIEALEALRDRGARYLLFPRTAFWWLDHYTGLREHLDRNYERLVSREDTCQIYSLN